MDNWIIGKKHSQDILSFLSDQAYFSSPPIVCFDYFDTLVVRHVEPEHTKRLAARLLSHVMHDFLSGPELYRIRQELEKKICEQSAAAGGDLDFNLTDFSHHYYRLLQAHEQDLLPAGWELETFVQLILDLELAVEKSVQAPCIETIRVLQDLKNKEVTTVLLSDFYLPGSHFKLMLEAHELHDLFDHVYISADYGMTKGSGKLYEKVCEDLACRPEQMVMIGDNPHADIKMARDHGIRPIQVHNPSQQESYRALRNRQQAGELEVGARFGHLLTSSLPFPEMGYTLWLFICRLFQQLREDSIKNVFFFSKEGEYLKRLFDRFQQDIYGHEIIKSHYLLVSRKATFLASLRPLDKESFSRLFNHYRDISIRDFLLSLNIEEQVAITLCKDLDLEYESRHFDLKNSPEFGVLLKSQQFRQIYEERRCLQRENFIQYLDSLGVDYRNEGMTIVDVGWKGSIQDNVFYILEGKVDMQGYYVGSLIATERRENNRKKGVVFGDYPEPTPFFKVFNNNRSLYEMMLGASHGSADGYYTRGQYDALPQDKHRAIHATVLRAPDDICVVVLDLPEERQLYKASIKPIQDEYFDLFIKVNREYLLVDCGVPSVEWFARQHARMVFKPTETEVCFFERLYHLENFGIFEFTDFRSDNRLGVRQRLRNLRELVRDKEQLETGIWPPIILRRLGLNLYRHIDGHRRYKEEFKGRGN